VLLGAPTGSGKTISAELAMLRVFNHYPGQKIIYIAPLKVSNSRVCVFVMYESIEARCSRLFRLVHTMLRINEYALMHASMHTHSEWALTCRQFT